MFNYDNGEVNKMYFKKLGGQQIIYFVFIKQFWKMIKYDYHSHKIFFIDEKYRILGCYLKIIYLKHDGFFLELAVMFNMKIFFRRMLIV